MKIPGSEGYLKNVVSNASTKGSKKADAKGGKVSGSEGKSAQGRTTAEKVLLSTEGRDIAKISEIVKASPDIRTEKVERIKNEIAQGTYSVDGEEIAQKILEEILAESKFLK